MSSPASHKTASRGFYFPKEHGGWALLVAPPLVGFGAAGDPSAGPVVQFFMGALGAYLIRTPLESYLRNKGDRRALVISGIYALVGLAAFVPLIFFQGRPLLGIFGAGALAALGFQLRLGAHRAVRSAGAEAFGISVLSLGAPAAYYTATGALDAEALNLWALTAVFFIGPVFYVKMVMAGHIAANTEGAYEKYRFARKSAFIYHAATVAAVLAAACTGVVPFWAWLPFIVALGKVLWRGGGGPSAADFRRVGWQEVCFSLFFVLITGAAFH